MEYSQMVCHICDNDPGFRVSMGMIERQMVCKMLLLFASLCDE